MTRLLAAFLTALAVIGGFAIPVYAGPLSQTVSGTATLTPTGTPGIVSVSFTGQGQDATYGTFSALSTSTDDLTQLPVITITDILTTEIFSQGDLFAAGSGTGTASGTGMTSAMYHLVITGGTGIFAGATGEVTADVTLTVTSPTTESITGTIVGSLRTVAEPEPGPLTLLAPAALVLWYRRRRGTAVR